MRVIFYVMYKCYFNSEAGGDTFLRKVGNRLHGVTTQQTTTDFFPISHFLKKLVSSISTSCEIVLINW
jgi:hypothetical protein